METIKNYLESMFRSLPKTEKVLRAKSELLQMMEDKYTELIENGVSENEAVGTVISEFGNLEELAEDLGISDEINVKNNAAKNSRKVSFEEVQDFLTWRMKVPIFRGLGIAICICCVVPPIIFSSFKSYFLSDVLGPAFMFLMIALGVCLIIFAGNGGNSWNFLRQEPCAIDDKTYNYVAKKKHDFVKTYSVLTSIAVACYVLSCVPAIVFSSFSVEFFDNFGGACIFILVAIGVFLNVYASSVAGAYNFILGLNSSNNFDAYWANNSFEGNASSGTKNNNKSWNDNSQEDNISNIKNPKIRKLLSVYWLSITCIYLCWSFLTFHWHITWIIWPIAGVTYALIKAFAARDDE